MKMTSRKSISHKLYRPLPRQRRQRQRRHVGLLATYTAFLLCLPGPLSVVSFGLVALSARNRPQNLMSSSSSSSSTPIDIGDSEPISKPQQQKHVVVVGGGVGGMAVAARIASDPSSDTRVTILEKNEEMGGRCGSFWVNPKQQQQQQDSNSNNLFRHEQGPSLLLLPKVYEEVFTDTTSKTARDYGLEIVQCAPAYQVVFDDGDRISAGFPKDSNGNADSGLQKEELESRAKMDAYEPDGATKWDDYMSITAAYLDAGLPNFIEEKLDLWSLPNFLVQSLKGFGKAWPLKPHSEVLDALFESNKLKALASFQDLYVGLEPYQNSALLGGGVLKSTAPAVFGLLAAIELHPTNKNAGVFAPIGGFLSVTRAFEALLEDLGVATRCETTVLGVTNEGVWATKTSKSTNGDGHEDKKHKEFIPADLVIVNADLPYAKQSLLMKENKNGGDSKPESSKSPPPPLAETFDWDDSFSFSSGVISFYWSLDKPLEDLNTHNVFLSTKTRSQAEASWQVLRGPPSSSDSSGENRNSDENETETAPFNFYVHRPSKTDPSAAPPGCDTLMVLVPCRTLLRDEECAGLPRSEAMKRYRQQFSEDSVARIRRAVLQRFAAIESLRDLEDHILHEDSRTPATWADRYNLAAGTPFALSHGFAQLSLTRPGPKSTGLPNVLYCGASTRPGNGVPLVLIGAKQVAEKAVFSLRTTDNTD